jgi:hypothetical protein
MRIAYVDPGLSGPLGHNAAMVEEFDASLVREYGHVVSYAVGASVDARDFPHLSGRLVPAFRIDGYARPGPSDLHDPTRLSRIIETIATDLQSSAVLDDCDAVLMPTAYPFHVRALALLAPRLRGRRVVIGLLLPARYWTPGGTPAADVADLFGVGLHLLGKEAELFLYNETGTFELRDSVLSLPRLLPPFGTTSAKRVRELAARSLTGDRTQAPSLGFFGSPFGSKGFGMLASAVERVAQAGGEPRTRLVVRLPQGHEAICKRLQEMAPWVDARSERTSNEAYLAEMAAVDAVWAFYDPAEYGDKMSGIVPEALSLSKPLLIADGCRGIEDFLEWQAPGSFMCGAYDERTVVDVLSLPAPAWSRASSCAREHAPLIAQLKSMPRYLAVCGLI